MLRDAGVSRGAYAAGGSAGRRDGHALPLSWAAGQDGHDAGCALWGPRLARHRRRALRGGGARAGDSLPAARRAVRAPRGDPTDLFAYVEWRAWRRTPLYRDTLRATAPAQPAAEPEPPAPTDPDRWRRRAKDAAAGGALRRRVQPAPDAGDSKEA